jgi:branched-subunit amino acid ABC-type transport system permease component
VRRHAVKHFFTALTSIALAVGAYAVLNRTELGKKILGN